MKQTNKILLPILFVILCPLIAFMQEVKLGVPVGHNRGANINWSVNGNNLVSVENGIVKIWDVSYSRLLHTLHIKNADYAEFYNSDIFILITSHKSDGITEIWDGKNVVKVSGLEGSYATVSPNHRFISTIKNDSCLVFFCSLSAEKLGEFCNHSGAIRIIEWSKDSRYLLSTADKDSNVIVINIEKMELESVLNHSSSVTAANWSSDQKYLLTRSDETKIWDTSNFNELYSQTIDTESYAIFYDYRLREGYRSRNINKPIFWSPDSRFYFNNSDSLVEIWDISNNSMYMSFVITNKHNVVLTWSPCSEYLCFVYSIENNDICEIWDMKNQKKISTINKHSAPFWVVWSQDSKYIATFNMQGFRMPPGFKRLYRDYIIYFWDIQKGQIVYQFDGFFMRNILFEDDNVLLSNRFGIYNIHMPDKKIINEFVGQVLIPSNLITHPAKSVCYVNCFNQKSLIQTSFTSGEVLKYHKDLYYKSNSLSPDNTKLISFNTLDSIVNVISLFNSDEIVQLATKSDMLSKRYYWFRDNKRILEVLPNDNRLDIFDAQTGSKLYKVNVIEDFPEDWKTGSRRSGDYGIQNDMMFIKHHTKISVYCLNKGEEISKLENKYPAIHDSWFSYDGNFIATRIDNNHLVIWNTKSGSIIKVFDDDFLIRFNGYLWMRDSNTLVFYCNNNKKTFCYYADADKPETIPDPAGSLNLVRNWTFHNEQTIHINKDVLGVYNIKTGQLVHQIDGHCNFKKTIRTDNGESLILFFEDGSVSIWDALIWKRKLHLKSDLGDIVELEWSEDKREIYTILSDGSIGIFDSHTGKMLLQQFFFEGGESVVLAENGLFDATPGAMDKMYWVQGLDFIEFEQLKDRYWEPGLWRKVMSGEKLRDVTGFEQGLPMFPKVENLLIDEDNVSFELVDNGGGIGKYIVYINDKEAFVGNDPEKRESFSGKIQKLNYNIANHPYLIPGEDNDISVRAYNAENFLISRGVTVFHTKQAEEVPDPNIFIVSCGISDYTGNQIDLRYAAKDAEDIAKAFKLGAEKLFGKEKTHLYLLSTDNPDAIQPTKPNIKKVFKEISEKSVSTDIVVLYLAGHGINWGGHDGDFYFLTAEAYSANPDAYSDPAIRNSTTMSTNEFAELFREVSANKQVFIVDACASGQVVEDLLAHRDISSGTIRALDRMKDRTGMFIITGSAADAVSYEASRFGQGLLTYTLLEGIRGASLREAQFIDVNMLFQHARNRVPVLAQGIGGIQTPQIFSPRGSASFDIGMLTEQSKMQIPLATEKPVFVMSNFYEADSFDDILGLANLVDEHFRNLSARGAKASLVFFDTRNFPDSYRLRGQYTIEKDIINLRLNLFLGNERIESIEIKGNPTNLNDFVNSIVKEIERVIE